jgi:lactoylglutathione lyase
MKVERLKYVIWAADMNRAVNFYAQVFGGTILKQNDIMICDGIIGGGEGSRTWTGLSFQVPDVIEGAPKSSPQAASAHA